MRAAGQTAVSADSREICWYAAEAAGEGPVADDDRAIERDGMQKTKSIRKRRIEECTMICLDKRGSSEKVGCGFQIARRALGLYTPSKNFKQLVQDS